MIDHVKKKATNLQRVTYLVFDEADRMFDMGFGTYSTKVTVLESSPVFESPVPALWVCKIK